MWQRILGNVASASLECKGDLRNGGCRGGQWQYLTPQTPELRQSLESDPRTGLAHRQLPSGRWDEHRPGAIQPYLSFPVGVSYSSRVHEFWLDFRGEGPRRFPLIPVTQQYIKNAFSQDPVVLYGGSPSEIPVRRQKIQATCEKIYSNRNTPLKSTE